MYFTLSLCLCGKTLNTEIMYVYLCCILIIVIRTKSLYQQKKINFYNYNFILKEEPRKQLYKYRNGKVTKKKKRKKEKKDSTVQRDNESDLT